MNHSDPNSPFAYPPSQTALLLLDFHTCLLPRISASDAERVVPAAVKIRNWALSKNVLVVHGLIDFHREPLPSALGRDRLTGWMQMVRKDISSADEVGELRSSSDSSSSSAGNNDQEIRVTRRPGLLSALKSEGLLDTLKEKGIKSVVITGIATSICVMRTAFAAADEDFVVTVLEDACADPSAEVEQVALGKLITYQGHVLKTDEFMKEWEESHEKK